MRWYGYKPPEDSKNPKTTHNHSVSQGIEEKGKRNEWSDQHGISITAYRTDGSMKTQSSRQADRYNTPREFIYQRTIWGLLKSPQHRGSPALLLLLQEELPTAKLSLAPDPGEFWARKSLLERTLQISSRHWRSVALTTLHCSYNLHKKLTLCHRRDLNTHGEIRGTLRQQSIMETTNIRGKWDWFPDCVSSVYQYCPKRPQARILVPQLGSSHGELLSNFCRMELSGLGMLTNRPSPVPEERTCVLNIIKLRLQSHWTTATFANHGQVGAETFQRGVSIVSITNHVNFLKFLTSQLLCSGFCHDGLGFQRHRLGQPLLICAPW